MSKKKIVSWLKICGPCFVPDEVDTSMSRIDVRNRIDSSNNSRGVVLSPPTPPTPTTTPTTTTSSSASRDNIIGGDGAGTSTSTNIIDGDSSSTTITPTTPTTTTTTSSSASRDIIIGGDGAGTSTSTNIIDGDSSSTNIGGGRGDGAGTSTSTNIDGGGSTTITSMTKEQEAALSFWSEDLIPHYSGSFSIAVIQANKILEDFSQVEVGKEATFVGIYDGHGGSLTAQHVSDHLTADLMGIVRETQTMSMKTLKQAFLRTETTWLHHVNAEFDTNPVLVADCGTCCLVGVVWRNSLYVANVGDCRAVLGRVVEVEGSPPKITFQPLTRDDNVKDPIVRKEVQDLYPDDPDIVIRIRGTWRVKGKLQVSKAIGDACLKIPRYNLDKYEGHELNKPVLLGKPAVTAEPIPTRILLQPQDRFVIFASDGLWDQFSNKEAVDIVHQNPKEGIAARLIREALVKRAKKIEMSYDDILNVKVESGLRRENYFDDITVVVLFLKEGIQQGIPLVSVKGGKNQITVDKSSFTALDDQLVVATEEGMPAGLEGGGDVGASSTRGVGDVGVSSSGAS